MLYQKKLAIAHLFKLLVEGLGLLVLKW